MMIFGITQTCGSVKSKKMMLTLWDQEIQVSLFYPRLLVLENHGMDSLG